MIFLVKLKWSSWHFCALYSKVCDDTITCNSCFFIVFPFVSFQLDPVMASRACSNDGGGNWIPCGQKPEQVTVHRDNIPDSTRQVSLCLLLRRLHFSTPLLPLSSSASPSPLLSFPSTFLDIRSSRDTQVTVFTAKPAQCCIHSFLHCFLPHSPASQVPSMPTPPSAWLLTRAYFTVAHIKQPDEGNTVRLFGFSEEYDSSQGHIVCLCGCVWVCVFPLTLVWNIEDEKSEQTGSFCSEHLE